MRNIVDVSEASQPATMVESGNLPAEADTQRGDIDLDEFDMPKMRKRGISFLDARWYAIEGLFQGIF